MIVTYNFFTNFDEFLFFVGILYFMDNYEDPI
jgi:hypothetical protein